MCFLCKWRYSSQCNKCYSNGWRCLQIFTLKECCMFNIVWYPVQSKETMASSFTRYYKFGRYVPQGFVQFYSLDSRSKFMYGWWCCCKIIKNKVYRNVPKRWSTCCKCPTYIIPSSTLIIYFLKLDRKAT